MRFLFIFASLLFFCNTIAADEQTICSSAILTIKSFDISDQKTHIHLSNGTTWTYKDADLLSSTGGWEIGDRVEFFYVTLGGYYLQNMSYRGTIFVEIKKDDSELKTAKILKVLKNEEKSTYKLTLDDDSTWFIGSWSGHWMENWQEGDRLIITPQRFILGNADHIIINMDREKNSTPTNVRAQLMHAPQMISYQDANKRDSNEWKLILTNFWIEDDAFILEMDNKTRWRCALPEKEWTIGDELSIQSAKHIKIVNLNNDEDVEGELTNGSDPIVTLTIKEISKNGKITLNDDSIWLIGSKTKWEVGDRIIVSPFGYLSINSSTHRLFNVDKYLGKSLYSATLIR